MTRHVRRRFWVEICLASASAALLIVTLVWKDWIEIVFHVEPDQGSGYLEWMIVAGLATTSVVLSIAGRREWRRPRAESARA